MQHEYKRDEQLVSERFTLSHGGSSARMMRADEMDADLRQRKMAESGDTDTRYIEMFCERYCDRGIAGRVHAAAAKQQKKEALHRAKKPGAYVKAETLAGKEKLDTYRTGVSNGKRYMTVDDFDRYYHDQRDYKFPQYRVVTDEQRIAAVRAVSTVSTTQETRLEQPKKAGWLTDTDKLPKLVQNLMRYRAFRWLNEWAGETFPRETEMRVDGSRRSRPLPAGMVAALVTVVVSMTMVIGSTVLVSQATRDVSQMRRSLSRMEDIHSELCDELDLKHSILDIEDKAVNELGMVHEKYLSGKYLGEESEDYLEIYDENTDGEKSGWSAILSAFGFEKD